MIFIYYNYIIVKFKHNTIEMDINVLPVIPQKGNFVLTAVDGDLQWVAVDKDESLPPKSKGKKYMVILAGQSNMVGAAPVEKYEEEDLPHSRIFSLIREKGTNKPLKFAKAEQPLHHITLVPHGVGLGMTFAKEFLKDKDFFFLLTA